jgi:flagellar hook protein FlgE
MLTSFFSGLAGLNSNSTYLSAIGNNLANVNTVGFKHDAVAFADVLHQNLGSNGAGNPMQLGMGSKVADISPIFTQGGLQSTGVETDIAIEGRGFLVADNSQGRFYTRAGNLVVAEDGRLVTPDGSAVQGYTTRNASGNIVPGGSLSDITVPIGKVFDPFATTNFNVLTNLDAQANVGDTFNSSLVVYDSLGAAHPLSVVFTNTAPGAWNYSVEVDGGEITGGTAGTPIVLQAGTLAFDGTGNLDAATGVDGAAPADVTVNMGASQWANGANQNTFNWDIVNTDGTFNLTGFASASATSSTIQDGIGAGSIEGLLFDNDGILQGLLSNGQTVQIAQLALAEFNNPTGLLRAGNNLFRETVGSGQPSLGAARTGGRGRVSGGTLELSNVDIAEEFVKLITAQRGYQASSRIITTSDEVTQEAINLKR